MDSASTRESAVNTNEDGEKSLTNEKSSSAEDRRMSDSSSENTKFWNVLIKLN